MLNIVNIPLFEIEKWSPNQTLEEKDKQRLIIATSTSNMSRKCDVYLKDELDFKHDEMKSLGMKQKTVLSLIDPYRSTFF